jgi:hypothetical protein
MARRYREACQPFQEKAIGSDHVPNVGQVAAYINVSGADTGCFASLDRYYTVGNRRYHEYRSLARSRMVKGTGYYDRESVSGRSFHSHGLFSDLGESVRMVGGDWGILGQG